MVGQPVEPPHLGTEPADVGLQQRSSPADEVHITARTDWIDRIDRIDRVDAVGRHGRRRYPVVRGDGVERPARGTVEVTMADPLEPERPTDAEAGARGRGSRGRGRRLDARMVAICLCVAVIGSVASYLIATAVWDRSDRPQRAGAGPAPDIELSNGDVDGAKLLATDLQTPDGKATTLRASLGDKAALVNLWQQSCAPCVKEMPLLQKVHQRDGRVDVIGVDTQDRPELARAMAARTGITYPWLQDRSGDFFYAAQGVGLPTSILVEPSGDVLAVRTGPFDSFADVTSWLDDHLR